MSDSKIAKGQCLCGAVTVSFPFKNDSFDACHCGMCRKWGGSPIMTVHAETTAVFTGTENITTFDSSEWAERGFCKKCGTHLFYRLKASGDSYIPVGLLNNTEHLKFNMQIFIDKKPENYSFANQTAHMTEAEVFARFAP